jgi:ParB-like chromosome segregation protein Spo0J
MAKTKKGGSRIQTKAENYVILDLRHVKANTYQSRGNGVVSNLNAAGYGLFEPLKGHDDKPPVWSLLTSDKPEQWAQAVGLLDEFEPDIKELAESLAGSAQLHNIGVVPLDGGGYDVVYGMRRCLARAYNHARSGGELPLTIKAEIAQDIQDPHDGHFRAIAENKGRKDESKIDEAKRYHFLKRNGVSIPQIADKAHQNQQNVLNALALLRLTTEEQQRVHTGQLGLVNALKMLKKREDREAAPTDTAKGEPEDRRRMSSLDKARKTYTAVEKPKDMDDAEWALWISSDVRRFLAYFMGVEFTTFKDMKAKDQAG